MFSFLFFLFFYSWLLPSSFQATRGGSLRGRHLIISKKGKHKQRKKHVRKCKIQVEIGLQSKSPPSVPSEQHDVGKHTMRECVNGVFVCSLPVIGPLIFVALCSAVSETCDRKQTLSRRMCGRVGNMRRTELTFWAKKCTVAGFVAVRLAVMLMEKKKKGGGEELHQWGCRK